MLRAALLAGAAGSIMLSGCATAPVSPAAPGTADPRNWPVAASPAAITDAAAERQAAELLARMSVEEKVGQIIQADIGSIKPEDLRTYPLGSILAGGNSAPGGNDRAPASEWLALARAFKAVAAENRPGHVPVPLIFGVDAVHGNNNIVGATIFPHNIGLGAARDPDLIRRIGEATAIEAAVTGVDWTFGPTVAVPRDDRWGRTYEGYAEDPEVVRTYAGPMTIGLQGELQPGRPLAADRIAGSAKHFVADGGNVGGKDQGDAPGSERELVDIHAQGYPPAIDAGILTVMASFSSWQGVKHHGNKSLLTDVLKDRMGFRGFVVGDWNAHGQVTGCTNESCPQSINAGLDMFMAPDSWKALYDNTLRQVRAGEIPMARLDDAVTRILRVKIKSGLFGPRPMEGRFERLGAAEHRAVAREAVRKSLVLLKNNGGVLPLRANARVLVAGGGADNIGQQSGGWTLTWQGTGNKNSDFPNGQSIYGGIAQAVAAAGGNAELSVDGRYAAKPDVAVVVFGEQPYAEFQGDIATVEYQPGNKTDLALIKRLKAQGIPVVAVFLSGRPLWTNPEINAADAFVAAWLPGTEGGGVADVLVRKADGAVNHDFTGKLSFSWPKRADQSPLNRGEPGYDPQFAYGYGLTYAREGVVPLLDESSAAKTATGPVDVYFTGGRALPPWSLSLIDGSGSRRVGTEPEVTSPGGVVRLRSVDAAGAQEAGKAAVWNGAGPGSVVISGPAVDLSRQANGEMAVSFQLRVDQAPTGAVSMAVGCETGDACRNALDVTSLLQGSPTGQWRTVKIRLSCFAGIDRTRIEQPFSLTTNGRLGISFAEVRLASNEGDAVCPSAPAR